MKSLKHINKYFYKYRVRLLLGVFFVSLSNIFGIFLAKLAQKSVDFAVNATKSGVSGAAITHQLLIYFLLIIGSALISGFFMFLMRQTIIVMSRLIEYDMKNEIFDHYQQLDMGFYKRNNTGDLMNRISEDVSRVRMYIGPSIMYIVNTVITLITVIFFMTNVNTTLTFYVLLPLPFLAVAIYYVSHIINKKSNEVQQQLSRLSTFSQETFSGIRVVKSFTRENFFNKNFEKESNIYTQKTLSLAKTEAFFMPFMVLMIGLSIIITVYAGGLEQIKGNVTVGNISEFILYVFRLTWPIASLGWVTSLIQRAAASQTRINEFLHTEPEIKNPAEKEESINGEIEFKNVSFAYPDSGTQALENISFKIEKGKSLAVIGRTGSGKSTLANLICRLYDVNSGEISIDGKNIQKINLNSLREQVGYVPQEVFLFSETISNNIAFTSNNSLLTPNSSLIEQAAKDAVIYSNIIEFPKGFDTMVGERGITLSGGQKQRVSIARAIIKSPQILIFDDCLSAIDTETEEQILNNLNRIMKGKTSIIISHRVSSVKNADNIIVMDAGKIIEEGTHQQLLNKKGAYFELHQMQLLENEQQ